MKRIHSSFVFAIQAAAFALFISAAPASAQTLYGTLSNFDVFNDTGQQTHGFEIEFDGITSKDLSYTFGAPYIRYGTPAAVDFPGGVYVRYQSSYDTVSKSFTAGTPVPPSITPTAGHSCWTGGAPGYLSSGCEHFGVGLLKAPTATVYRWLIADPNTPGALTPFGTNVSIPAPLWSVTPPAVAGGAAVVQAVLEAPKPVRAQFGDAVWVKVYESESPDRAELNHLLTDDPLVPQGAAQVETEWELLQNNPKKAGNGALQHGKPLGKGNQSVIRRFEYFKFTGTYDPQSHEARCSGGECKTPAAGELGAYIGAQMAAAQLGPLAPQSMTITGVASATGQAGIESGSWVSIYGTNLSLSSRLWRDSDFTGNSLPMSLDGVSVKINGKDAAVYGITPGQLNVQAPTDAAAGLVQVQVTNSLGTATGSATLLPYAPGFFAQGKYVAAVHTDGVLVVPVGFYGGAPSRPALPGETLLIYGSGFGPTSPAVPAGQIFNGAAPLTDPSQLHIRIGGVPAKVTFAGMVFPGEYQFNVQVPALPDGDYPIVADIGGVSTPAGLLIAVKN